MPAAFVIPEKIRVPRVHGLPRPRLEQLLRPLWEHRLAIVVAPAGSGKTTLLGQFASGAGVPAAWYRAESGDGDSGELLAHLEAAFSLVVPDLARGWESLAEGIGRLEAILGSPTLLVLDDLHTIEGTSSEALLQRFLEYAPPRLVILAASRRPPRFDLTRLRLSGSVIELGMDDLRFRLWEAEDLFSHFYGQPLGPEDLAELARRTGGWAAGLQLFHLATRGKPAPERRRVLQGLGTRVKLVREYLARNVLDGLRPELQRFLVETCVLGRLTGRLCDELLGRSGSDRLLEELERTQIFTSADDGGTYRYHEVLRGHLEVILLERVGEAEIRERYLRAARLLQAAGALAEALEAYCRAGDWEATARLLGHEGEQLAQDPGQWLDLLTPQLRRDPWVLLATARRHRNAGRWAAALEAYREAGDALGEGLRGEASRRERMWLETLVGAEPAPAPGRSAVLRSATRAPHRALVTARAMGGGGARLAQGLAALFGGRLGEARSALAAALDEADAGPGVLAAASLGLAVTRLLAGDAGARPSLESAIEEADGAALPWLARIGRAAFALTDRPDGRSEAASVLLAAERDGDGWGVGLAGLLGGLGRLRLGEAHDESLRRAAEAFRRMDAPALEAWALGALALALARRRDPGAAAAADGAEILARATGARPALALAYLALAAAAPGRAAPRLGEAARAIAAESGFELPEPGGRSEEPDAAAPPASSLRCFGGLRLVLLGRELDLRALKPRVRELLRILGLHAGRPVHREVLIEALWPEVDPDTGTRNLHVAVSALRHLTDLPGTASTQSVVVREGDAYRLGLPTGAVVDLTTFEAAVSAGRRARTSGDGDAAEAAFRQALDLHAGDLLPEAGPATWVVAERERYRAEAVEAASSLAAILLERADPEEAAAACERGLRVDRYQDRLWRLLVRAHEASGSLAAAVAARTRYREVLEALGVPATGTLTRTTS